MEARNRQRRYLVLGGTIVVAAAAVAAAVVAGNQPRAPAAGTDSLYDPAAVWDAAQQHAALQEALDNLAPVTDEDHIRGERNASIVIVEYSDFECPFCKRFHTTMQQIMREYGPTGDVAWVYRHFPLEVLHPVKARQEAVAAECAGELGGNDAFWAYADRLFEVTLSNSETDVETVVPQVARELGLDGAAFAACRQSGKHDERIDRHIENAVATGAPGTPWSILVASDGTKYPIHGALPYTAVERLIENVREN